MARRGIVPFLGHVRTFHRSAVGVEAGMRRLTSDGWRQVAAALLCIGCAQTDEVGRPVAGTPVTPGPGPIAVGAPGAAGATMLPPAGTAGASGGTTVVGSAAGSPAANPTS